jgi:SAM-dependent methyltransferase
MIMIKKIYRQIKRISRRVISICEYPFYIGNKYECPICDGKFNRFKTYRGHYFIKGINVDHTTKNYSCPKCYSSIRHRLVVGFLKENKELLFNSKNLLHFAPEVFIIKYIKQFPNLQYVKADIDPTKFKEAIKLDLTSIDLDNKSFDAIICIHVLEHIENDSKAINELYRVLNDKGWLLLAVPIYGEKTLEIKDLTSKEKKLQFGIEDHQRLNGLDLKLKLEKAGFTVRIVTTNDIKGNYFDISLKTPHSESGKHLFFCKK